MAARGGGAPPETKDFQMSCSWIPTTPVKPNSTAQHLICGNWQADDSSRPSWVESETYCPFNLVPQPILSELGQPRDYGENTHCHAARAGCSTAGSVNLSGNDKWQERQFANPPVLRDIFHKPEEIPIKDINNFMPFQTLLALADAGGNQVAIENALTDSCSSDPSFITRVEGCLYMMSCGSSSLQGQDNLPKETLGAGLDIASVLTGASTVQSRPPFDLNSPSRMMRIDATFCSNNSFQFKPIIPQKNNEGEYLQESPTGKDAKKNNITGDVVMKLHGKKEKSNQIMDQTSAATRSQLQKNHKPNKGSMEEIDFTKTPQKKGRRRKHQPKVIIECQKKNIPKLSPKTPFDPQETTRVKRKYVQGERVTDPSVREIHRIGSNNKEVSSVDAPTGKRKYTRREGANKHGVGLDKETTKATEVVGPRRSQSSCRRSLNFNSDYQVRDESSSCSMNQLQEDDSSNMDPLKVNTMPGGDQTFHTRGKCQLVFSNETHDKETSIVQMRMNTDSQRKPKVRVVPSAEVHV